MKIKVLGESMWPRLVPGKKYPLEPAKNIEIGDFVVFKNPFNKKQTLVKKVCFIQKNLYKVRGLVSWSVQELTISQRDILGKIAK